MRGLFLTFLLTLPALVAGGVPHAVVSQTVGTDDLLMAIAAPGQIAALSHLSRDGRYSPTARQAANYPSLRTGDAEDILRLRPDLVLVASYSLPETVTLLKRAKVPLVILDHFNSLEDLYRNARTIGQALGRSELAEQLIRQWQARVLELDRRLRAAKPVRVLAVGFYPYTAGAGTTFQDICDHAGALNVAAEAGLQGHAPTPAEKILTWKVDVLVAPGEEGMDVRARLQGLAPYKFMAALRQGRLVLLPAALMASTSQARLDAYEWLAKALHPEAFR